MNLCLNDGWKLLHRGLEVTADSIMEVAEAADFIDAGPLPCDVRMPLIRDGVIKDPVVADYCYDSEWVEERSWWFKKEFTLGPAYTHAREIQLVLESLDLNADIFINNRPMGCHQSCHYPFTALVGKYVREGVNTLIIRLTAGPEHITGQQISYIKPYVCTESDGKRGDRGEKSRPFLRKPQYVYGWDWGPRAATIGIMKNAYLNIRQDMAVTRIHPVTLETDMAHHTARIRFEVEFESFLPLSTCDTDVTLEMCLGDEKVLSLTKNVLAVSGVNFIVFDAFIPNARLWWPAGAGEQPLYTVRVSLKSADGVYMSEPVQTGIRTVSLNVDKLTGGGRRFAVEVNGVGLYCKGANWIPADAIYARVTPQKYETLIREARECHFNMLRVWGGGIYEQDVFYNLCDQHGILIWQDFMFACSLYPDDQEWFRLEAAKEIHYQTRRLSHHPCIAIWCGNNENQSIFEKILSDGKRSPTSGGLMIYNHIAPAIVRHHCPEIPYWRSSPYGGKSPNDHDIGDRHHWGDCTMNPMIEKRITPEEYDKVTSGFVTEYGYIGPCSKETIQKYYDGKDIVRGDRIWNLHNNTFEQDTVPAGIRKHYADPDTLTLDGYLQYARLVQGLMYAYSLESIRFYEHSSGSLYWMFNDTWGEVGWTTLDYYLDRKPSYYYVKRAFAPVKLILRLTADGQSVRVMGVNDTPIPVPLCVEYGFAGFDGRLNAQKTSLTLKPFSKAIALCFPLPPEDLRKGVVFARANDDVPLALLRTGDFRDYESGEGRVSVEKTECIGNDYKVTVKSIGFSHAVSFGLPSSIRLSDEYFDMLPGDVRVITFYNAADKVSMDDIHASRVNPMNGK